MITLTSQEKQFIEEARDATVVSLGLGNLITREKPRVEISGMVIEYDDPERAAAVYKLVMEEKKGDF